MSNRSTTQGQINPVGMRQEDERRRDQAEQGERALAALAEAAGLWRELGILNMLSDNLATASMIGTMSGHYEAALAHSAESAQIVELRVQRGVNPPHRYLQRPLLRGPQEPFAVVSRLGDGRVQRACEQQA